MGAGKCEISGRSRQKQYPGARHIVVRHRKGRFGKQYADTPDTRPIALGGGAARNRSIAQMDTRRTTGAEGAREIHPARRFQNGSHGTGRTAGRQHPRNRREGGRPAVPDRRNHALVPDAGGRQPRIRRPEHLPYVGAGECEIPGRGIQERGAGTCRTVVRRRKGRLGKQYPDTSDAGQGILGRDAARRRSFAQMETGRTARRKGACEIYAAR